MDQRIESLLADVLALAGEEPDAIREGVRVAFADCEAIFRAQEANKGIGAFSPYHTAWALCSIAHAAKEMHRLRDHVMPLQSCSPAFARPPPGCNAAWWRPAASTVRSSTSSSPTSARFPIRPRLPTVSPSGGGL